MQHFQPILIAIGILAIVGVLIHGFLLNRKNKLASIADKDEGLEEHFEVIPGEEEALSDIENLAFSDKTSKEKVEPVISLDNLNEQSDPVINSTSSHSLDNNDSEVVTETELCDAAKSGDEQELSVNSAPTDLFIFNVVAKDDGYLGGHKLLQFFLTSGFRFGDMNIFHRHEHSDGTGEVLFSIANMMAPGTFDLDEMEQFNTKGISFFLTAPNHKISVKQSFDLMLRAVVQLADEFECDVLNEQRDPLTESQFIEYRNRLQQYP